MTNTTGATKKGHSRFVHALSFPTIVRFGSTTVLDDVRSNGGRRVELNTVEGIKNTSNKEKMKQLFIGVDIPTSNLYICHRNAENIQLYTKEGYKAVELKNLKFPLVAKRKYHQKSIGMELLSTLDEFKEFLVSENARTNTYHYEQFFNGSVEYRIHASPHLDKEIFSVRKVRAQKEDGSYPWMFNLEQGGFLMEFDKPKNWDNIVKSVKASIASLGMDMGAADVRTSKDGTKFVIIEINSAPGVGENTASAYANAIKEILTKKYHARA